MILIFGGTTEGRTAAETLDEAGQPFYYSTRGTLQEVTCRNMTRLTGNMDSEKIISFCREHDIRLIIDAAHPFAQQLHLNIFLAAKELTIKVVRLERIYPELSEEIIWCDDFEDAVARMKQDGRTQCLCCVPLCYLYRRGLIETIFSYHTKRSGFSLGQFSVCWNTHSTENRPCSAKLQAGGLHLPRSEQG